MLPAGARHASRRHGASGSDRIEILWDDGAIRNTWLEVTVAANGHTGLAAPDVFYFGNRVGDTGLIASPVAAITNASDEIQVRANGGLPLPITSPFDFNRDKIVNATDQIIAHVNGGILPMLDLIGLVVPLAAAEPMAGGAPLTGGEVPLEFQAIASAIAARRNQPLELPAVGPTASPPVDEPSRLHPRAVMIVLAVAEEDASPQADGLTRAGS